MLWVTKGSNGAIFHETFSIRIERTPYRHVTEPKIFVYKRIFEIKGRKKQFSHRRVKNKKNK